ncbi:MAG: GNAT family N-acetyltransferase [Eubacteriales bacterium]
MKEVRLKDKSKMIFRELDLGDGEAVVNYLNKVGGETNFLTFGKEGISYTIQQEKVLLRNMKETKGNYMIGGYLKNKLVTVGSITSSSKERLKHKADIGISVLKDYWNIGIGSQMMEYLISLCRKNSFRKIDLIVYENNERAIKLYEKLGFVKEGLLTRDVLIDGVFYSSYHMGLKID